MGNIICPRARRQIATLAIVASSMRDPVEEKTISYEAGFQIPSQSVKFRPPPYLKRENCFSFFIFYQKKERKQFNESQ